MALKESNKSRKKETFDFVEEVVIEEPLIIQKLEWPFTLTILVVAILMVFII